MLQSESNGADRVAVIGFAGRFPGAKDVEEFWDNLKNGRESLRPVVVEEVPGEIEEPPAGGQRDVVGLAMVLDDVDLFDAAFFGYTDAQACRIDPQQRVFLEVAWHALEHAAQDVERYKGVVGVFAGASRCTYGGGEGTNRKDIQRAIDRGLGSIANRLSYKLNLDGPSIRIDTACSTSLVAVHLASQSLLNGECDMALAGGASIRLPQNGYVYQKNSILSPDGHCRAFDATALGTVPGNGVGIVVMKRMTDAIADRDRIYAVISGSAINNDGGHKAGYTAPSLQAQVSVIERALARAGVNARSIGMIEGHGTGTVVGDEIELTALTEVMANDPATGRGICALGAVKPNIGHLDTAAGVAGFIKAVLCISEKTLVPTINCGTPSPLLLRSNGSIRISSALQRWDDAEVPRRAGVSSFGIGGSNAHVVLEEFVMSPRPARSTETALICPMSGRTAGALNVIRSALHRHLMLHPDLTLDDVAFTLQVGRSIFAHRFCPVVTTRRELLSALCETGAPRYELAAGAAVAAGEKSLVLQCNGDDSRELIFLGSLYMSEPKFAAIVDRCLDALARCTSMTVDDLLRGRSAPVTILDLRERHLVRLLREYCLGQLWLDYGVAPSGVIGFGTGKLAAACISGIMSIDSACRLCLAAGADDDDARVARVLAKVDVAQIARCSWLGVSVWQLDQIGMCELVGSSKRIAAIRGLVESRDTTTRAHDLTCQNGFDPEDRLHACVEQIDLRPATIPYLSVADGLPITAAELRSTEYWHKACGFAAVAGESRPMKSADVALLVEPSLEARSRHDIWPTVAGKLYASVEEAGQVLDRHWLLSLLAEMWQEGVPVDWNGPSLSPNGTRVVLPRYPFERTRHWIDARENCISEPARPIETDAKVCDASAHAAVGALACGKPESGARTAGRLRGVSCSDGTELERVVANVWEEALEVQGIRLDDRFLDIGGDSLVGIRVAEHIESIFGVELSLDQLIRSDTTVRTMARLISETLLPARLAEPR